MQTQTISLSSKGQVVIPAAMRASLGWEEGLELTAISVGGCVMLKKVSRFPASTVDQLVGCLGGKTGMVDGAASSESPVRQRIMTKLSKDDERIKRSAQQAARRLKSS